MKKKLDIDDKKHQFLEKKNNSLKFYLREIDIEKNLTGSTESLSLGGGTMKTTDATGTGDDKATEAEKYSASFVAQTNWSFVEKLLKVRRLNLNNEM